MWPNPQETTDLVTFTEEILNEKLHFLCNVSCETSTSTEMVTDALQLSGSGNCIAYKSFTNLAMLTEFVIFKNLCQICHALIH